MNIIIEQECPQCGGAVALDECDRIFSCPFCGTRNFLIHDGPARFILPHRDMDNLLHVPYLRFKGSVYTCRGSEIEYRFVDTTLNGSSLASLPRTLGVRPQAMRLKFAGTGHTGRFLKCISRFKDILPGPDLAGTAKNSGPIHHQAHIGESISLVYQPISVGTERLEDAVTGDEIMPLSTEHLDAFKDIRTGKASWQPLFLATICPDCGWDLEGEGDSVLMSCRNCATLWEPKASGFIKRPAKKVAAEFPDPRFLPFWKITAEAPAASLKTLADLLEFTNQPKAILPEHRQTRLQFWSPAFKIKPKTFLRVASQVTLLQQEYPRQEYSPPAKAHPVNLPAGEAVQSLKLIMARSALNKKILARLPDIQFAVSDIGIVYIPFQDRGYNLIHPKTGLNINQRVLGLGRLL